MKFIAHIQEGLLNLLAAKLRSLLALLGILVGTASVVAMVSGGELATNEALKQFKVLGTDLLAVSITESNDGDQHANREASLSFLQAKNIPHADPFIEEAAPYTQLFNNLDVDGHQLNGSILGVTDSFARITHVKVAQGRFISALDHYALFCVIGAALNEQIKQLTFKEAMGQQIQIGKTLFTIVGIADPWPENSFVYANIDNAVMVPLLTSLALNKYTTINNIILRLMHNAPIDTVQAHITNYVNQAIPDKHLFFRSAKELIAKMGKQSEIFTLFLGLIGGISLLVGGIGVMNIMLVAIAERRPEIGIRLAVGASRLDIRWLFLMEAIMLSLMGGVGGVFLGMLITWMMASMWHWEFLIFPLPPLIGFTVSVVTGIFFGFYPALKASQLNPIQALRSLPV